MGSVLSKQQPKDGINQQEVGNILWRTFALGKENNRSPVKDVSSVFHDCFSLLLISAPPMLASLAFTRQLLLVGVAELEPTASGPDAVNPCDVVRYFLMAARQ